MNPTNNQIDSLLTFLEHHQELARGRLSNAEGRRRSQYLWAQLTDQLNALGGCHKNVKQWQKLWADKKYLVKKAAANYRRSASATGGGPSVAEPTTQEMRIMALMGCGYGEPETDARVTAFPTPTIPSQQEDAELEERQPNVAQTAAITLISGSRSQEEQHQNQARPGSSSVASLPQIKRRRVSSIRLEHADLRHRLFRLEEQRVAAETQRAQELALLRESVQELSRVVQDGFANLISVIRSLPN